MSEPSRKRSNSLCKAVGHDWVLTAAANWRYCQRVQCPASERLVDGVWVSNAALYRSHVSVLPSRRSTKQASLWNPDEEKGTRGS